MAAALVATTVMLVRIRRESCFILAISALSVRFAQDGRCIVASGFRRAFSVTTHGGDSNEVDCAVPEVPGA
ncbi:hypothetical protein [Actinomadura macra]|uniref:hypothetical protein n=1 Tax=Actinomadura macra TaxID=46164 RepID=UPI001471AFC3|nr:hypothetical protein [Actinomadura macra]